MHWTMIVPFALVVAAPLPSAAQSITSELTEQAPSLLEDLDETNRFINEDEPMKSDRWNPNIVEQVLPGSFEATNPGRADTSRNFGAVGSGTDLPR